MINVISIPSGSLSTISLDRSSSVPSECDQRYCYPFRLSADDPLRYFLFLHSMCDQHYCYPFRLSVDDPPRSVSLRHPLCVVNVIATTSGFLRVSAATTATSSTLTTSSKAQADASPLFRKFAGFPFFPIQRSCRL